MNVVRTLPGDPSPWRASTRVRAPERSTSEPAAPVSVEARPALPPVCLIRIQPAATAILHGIARRTAPNAAAAPSGSRASRWAAQESPAGAGRRCQSQMGLWRSMRRSTSEPAAGMWTSATGSTAGLPMEEQPVATAILHGLARRTAPQTQPPRSGSRASRGAAEERPRQKRGADKGEGKSRYAICKEEAAHTPNSSELAACGRLSQHGS